jgi:N-acyl-D-aspartate/D-glutamate deacylase
MTSIVIRGGTVVDGTGAPARPADVAISDGVITAIGDGLEGDDVIDATGLVVAPGFVDIHTHYDAQVFWDPALSSSCWHGVTTVVAGNCGFTIAPTRPEHRAVIVRTLQAVEDMSEQCLTGNVPWDFETFGEYLDSVERNGTVLNFACYVGHSAVRLFVMGDDGYDRPATPDEVARMRAVVREAMEIGACGFASSFSKTHRGDGGRPVPSRQSDHDEFVALSQAMAETGRGVVCYAPGAPVTYADAYELQARVGRPLMWTPMVTGYPEPDHHVAMQVHADGLARGAEVYVQVSCRPMSLQIRMANPYLFGTCPGIIEWRGLPPDEQRARYADPAWRARVFAEIAEHTRPIPHWDRITVDETTAHPELQGRSLAEIAEERGCNPFDVLCEVALDEDLETRFLVHLTNFQEDGVAEILHQDGAVLGQSDAGAHIQQLCDANMPTDLLGGWVRDRGVLSMERAVQMLSADLTDLYGFTDRGRIAVGQAADVVVFDPATVSPGPLRRVWDLPTGEDRLVADQPTGIVHVLVNGTPIQRDGRSVATTTDARPGRVLRGATS